MKSKGGTGKEDTRWKHNICTPVSNGYAQNHITTSDLTFEQTDVERESRRSGVIPLPVDHQVVAIQGHGGGLSQSWTHTG